MYEETKLRAGNRLIPVQLEHTDQRIYFHFGYNKTLIEEIKSTFEGRKWHGFDDVNPQKIWSIPKTPHNLFQLEYLKDKYGSNPYRRWDQPLKTVGPIGSGSDYETKYPLYKHQFDLGGHAITVRWFIWGAEMGLGKTLAAFTVIDYAKSLLGQNLGQVYWVGPKSALRAVNEEYEHWRPSVKPIFVTYDSLKKTLENWHGPAPRLVIFDECQKLKNPQAQRTEAARYLADNMREEWGEDCFIGLMSGSPSPKSPADWWSLCRIACPGFLKEGTVNEFKNRLGIIQQRESTLTGGVYPHLVTWRDDESKCNICGQGKEAMPHQPPDFVAALGEEYHSFVPCKNEVANLYSRMKGLVLVKFKKDCLDLPAKIYRTIRVEPTEDILRAARLIVSTTSRAAQALILLRELSDGFQYKEVKSEEKETCQACKGTKEITEWFDPEYPDFAVEESFAKQGYRLEYSDDGDSTREVPIEYRSRRVTCPNCFGTGSTYRTSRSIIEVPCPKDDIVLEQLDAHEDVGRLVIYAGFQASIDKIAKLCLKQAWTVIQADGRGWFGITPKGERLPSNKLLNIFQRGQKDYERVAFCGQPGAAGTGLTLHASPSTLYYSNDFNADSRIQSEDRIHRIGMDVDRGGNILDIVHLPSDQYVLDNLKLKRDLMNMSMTGLAQSLENSYAVRG